MKTEANAAARARNWKLVCAGIALLFGTPALAQSTADLQVQAVFGRLPWNVLTGAGLGGGPSITPAREFTCTAGRDFPTGTDIFTASATCSATAFGMPGTWFRSDLDVDSTGSAPPSGNFTGGSGDYTAPRCSAFYIPTGSTAVEISCTLYRVGGAVPVLIVKNIYTKTGVNEAVSIDLTPNYLGALPIATVLEGAVVGGTVTGLSGTTVTFTPTPGFVGFAHFAFELASDSGPSNTATAWIFVSPLNLTPQGKAAFTQTATQYGKLSDAAGLCSIVFDPINFAAQKAVIAMYPIVSGKAFASIAYINDQITGSGPDPFLATFNYWAKNSTFVPSNGVSAFCQLLSQMTGAYAWAAKVIAMDGPDSNYTVVAEPPQLSFPSSGNATVDKALTDLLALYSYTAAMVHANERYQGAVIAGQPAWAAVQNTAFQKYQAEVTAAKAPLTADNAALIPILPAVNLNTFPGGAAALATLFQSICGQGLPGNLNLPLLSLANQTLAVGAQAEVNEMVCNAANDLAFNGITLNLTELLSQPIP
jgi:hypothetical protein